MKGSAPVCYDGTGELPARRRVLRAGPLVAEYESGELRYVRLGEREVVRRWYVAVRDRNWGTIPGRISEERIIDEGPDAFAVHFVMEHRQPPIDFAWRGSIMGRPDGTVVFRMAGEARTRFERNRIGFCILHPIRECAGAECRYEQGDGAIAESFFPRSIAPQNMFHELRRFSHEVAPGTWAELEFEGDLFEMEDQRNWIDASFKTFCTPLRLPFPVMVEAGQQVEQCVTLRLRGTVERGTALPATTPVIAVRPDVIGTLPRLGLVMAEGQPALSAREVDRLRAMRPDHLRVDLKLADAGSFEVLRRADGQARSVGCALEVALTVTDRADAELSALTGQVASLRPLVVRWLIFHESEWATSARWIERARSILGAHEPTIPIVSGSAANFTELNRSRARVELLDGACYSVHPQEHASDNTSLVETCAAIRDTLRTAREFCGELPLSVTPITLRRRVNPYATGPAPDVLPGSLPPRVDLRQMSLLGAGWTLGSLKALAEGGAASATWYETVGWLGVMEREAGCALPELFPSTPGMVFPLYHVLADAGEWAGAGVLAAESSDPLRCEALALRSLRGVQVIVANLSAEPTTVAITGLGATVHVRMLDEATLAMATQSPEVFRSDPGRAHATSGGRLDLPLAPYAYARVDENVVNGTR